MFGDFIRRRLGAYVPGALPPKQAPQGVDLVDLVGRGDDGRMSVWHRDGRRELIDPRHLPAIGEQLARQTRPATEPGLGER